VARSGDLAGGAEKGDFHDESYVDRRRRYTDTHNSAPPLVPISSLTDAHGRPAADAASALATNLRSGLSTAEARARRAALGANELASTPPVPAWRRFAAQFKNILVVLLLIATAVSLAAWWYERAEALPYEAIAIFAIVLLNAVMGFVQEARAEAALSALRAMSADVATVIRDGARERIPAAELVPGDVVLIGEGDTIPADARVVESTALHTAEAALTGESLPVAKDAGVVDAGAALGDRSNMLFAGTSATFGHARAVITATGMHTEMGRIAGLLRDAPAEATPLQQELAHTGRLLGIIVIAIAVVMIGTIIFVEEIHGFAAMLDVFILGVALAVAAVPEGLPAIVTAVLALGVQRMARRKAIVRHLAAVETLGSASVIAADKTGTLTKNEMTVRVAVTASGRVAFSGSGYAPAGEVRRADGGPIDGALRAELDRALAVADRANNAVVSEQDGRWLVQGDPTEGALLVAARKAGISAQEMEDRLPRIGELPFTSERKLMTTVHRDAASERRIVAFTKGAPDVLLARCSRELVGDEPRALTAPRRAEIERSIESLADEALRTLGVAIRHLSSTETIDPSDPAVEEDLVFAGLIGMIDPPRDEAKDAVRRARAAGVRPVMITGDHPRTAGVIARELGIAHDERVLTGTDLDRATDAELDAAVAVTTFYARVAPEHKLRIVRALQRRGEIVAMTGDGVNDAPALKTADIGVAMAITGTDVSKQAADIVLADDNFATIVDAIEEGRGIFANIRKFLRYLLSSNIGEVLTMFFGVLFARVFGLPAEHGTVVLPLVATQILWMNLVTDGAPALALGVDPTEDGLMREAPRPRSERVVTGRMWATIVLIGAAMAAATLLVMDASLPGGLIQGDGDLPYAQTMAFTTLVLAQLINVFNTRSERRSAFVHVAANHWLDIAVLLSLMLHVAVLYTPLAQRALGTVALSSGDWARCAVAASTVLWVSELAKLIGRWRSRAAGR
jgi:Ca2+-transporting ATPase